MRYCYVTELRDFLVTEFQVIKKECYLCRTLSINKGPGVKYEEICIRKSRKVREGARGQGTRATMVEEVDINV